jgi:hypothetical protein
MNPSFRFLLVTGLLHAAFLAPAYAACADAQRYPIKLYNPPGEAGYIGFILSVDEMVAKIGGYAPLLKNLRYVADMNHNTYGGPDMQQVQLNVNRAIAAVMACQQEEERAQAMAKVQPPAQATPPAYQGIDPSLYNTEDNSDGNQIFRRMAAAGTPFIPKNPQQDHTGEPCAYFTKPLVRPDGGGLNAYADGGHVAYGKFYYVCQNRRWVRLGPASAFANVQEHAAERLENSALSPQVYEKE